MSVWVSNRWVFSPLSLRCARTRSLVIATTILPLLASSRPSVAQTAAAVAAAEPLFIAGTEPGVRPPWAPRITVFQKNEEWYRRALTRISPPYPPSLRFLEDQGAWYTPFTHPGMTAPYDIRHWHGP
jgi:hypothetical protein